MSLKYRIALIIFSLESLMMGVVLTETISRYEDATRKHLTEAEDVVLELLTGVGRTTLLTREYSEMQPYLEQARKDSRVLRAMLSDHRGIVVASLDPRDLGAPLPEGRGGDHGFWRTVVISNASGISGTVAVQFSNVPLDEASAVIRRQAVAFAVVGMSVIAVVGVGTGLLLTRKLERVSTAARQLASGELGARSRVAGPDEIGQLGQSFDEMASALEADRKRIEETERALRGSEEHYRSLVDNVPISIHELDADGKMTSMSRSGLEMMGLSGDGPTEGASFLDLVDESHREEVGEKLRSAKLGEALEFEFDRTVAGSARTFRSAFYPMCDDRAKVTKILGVAQDITERRLAEKALAASETRLRQAQKMEAIGLLAGGVAHDFNNILTVITGYCDLILTQGAQAERQRLEAISKAADRATALTQQLLAFSRQQVLEPRFLNLNAVILDTNKMLGRVIGEDIEVATALDSTLGLIKVDPGQVQQVLMNLALNARDAMERGGRLSFRTRNFEWSERATVGREGLAEGVYVQLVVEDTGVGMTPEVLAHVFEPFFTTKEVGRGTGLGLATVYGIVKQSGGYVYVTSEPGRGTAFEILLPQASEARPLLEEPRPSSPARGGSGTILLVEDEGSVRSLVRDILVEHGYRVVEADNGEEALELHERYREEVVLVITDLVMPRMNGPELAAHIRARSHDVAILFMTGHVGGVPRADVASGENLLKKPFTQRELLERVRSLLDLPMLT